LQKILLVSHFSTQVPPLRQVVGEQPVGSLRKFTNLKKNKHDLNIN